MSIHIFGSPDFLFASKVLAMPGVVSDKGGLITPSVDAHTAHPGRAIGQDGGAIRTIYTEYANPTYHDSAMESPILSQLEALPIELQMGIMSFLDPRSVQAVLLTSRQLSKVALPFSVRTFKCNFPGYQDILSSEFPGSESVNVCEKLCQFLRHVTVNKKDLRPDVRTIEVAGYPSPSGDENEFAVEEEEVYRGMISRLVEEDPDSFPVDKYLSRLRHGCLTVALALLMTACPKLECIETSQAGARLFSTVLDWAAATPVEGDESAKDFRPLTHLREVCLNYQSLPVIHPLHINTFANFFRLPSVKSFEASGARLTGTKYPGRHIGIDEQLAQCVPEGSSSVEHIRMRYTDCTPKLLRNIVRAPRNLRSFLFVCRLDRPRVFLVVATPRDLMEGIISQAQTLEHLHAEFGKSQGSMQQGAYMGSGLQKMVALRRLVVEQEALTAVLPDEGELEEAAGAESEEPPEGPAPPPTLAECLPDNLEELEIRFCNRHILGQARALLRVIASGSRFTKIRKIWFSFRGEAMKLDKLDLTCDSPFVVFETTFGDDFRI